MSVIQYRTPGGKKAWKIDVEVQLPDGNRARLRKRKIPTEVQAKATEAKFISDAYEGRHFERSRTPRLTVRDLWELWEPETKRKNDSYKSDKGRAEHLLRHLGDREAMQLKNADVNDYREKRRKEVTVRGGAPMPATLNREIALLKRMYSHAVTYDRLPHSPIAKAPLLEEDNVRQRLFTDDERDRILEAAGPVLGPMLLVYLETGMRKNELRVLKRDQLDLPGRAIRLTADDTKGDQGRTIPLSARAVEALRSLPATMVGPYVFVNPETKKPWSDPQKMLNKVCKRLGIEGLWLHDTRRTFTTLARRAGSSESEVMQVIGQRTRSVFDRYNITDEKDARAVVERYEAARMAEDDRRLQESRQDSGKTAAAAGSEEEDPKDTKP
jgi:integrase